MATRGDAYRDERQRGGAAAAQRNIVGPGAGTRVVAGAVRIADRYHLEDRVSDSGQSALWRAFDDVLGRPVTVRTFGPGFAHGAKVVAAARAACRVPDSRLARVFDAHVAAHGAYIVTEWPDGENLEDLLTLGHLNVGWATRIVAEVASALAAAHAAGIAHLHLTPRSVLWSRDTGVKIIGLGIDAALADAALADAGVSGAAWAGAALAAAADTEPSGVALNTSPDGAARDALAALADTAPSGTPLTASADAARQEAHFAEMAKAAAELADTRALARVLYAALTGYWPGLRDTALPAAPRRDGRPYRPRQVRAGVSARIDEITCRALFEPLPRDPPPVTSPSQLAELLHLALHHESPQPAGVAAPRYARFVDGADVGDGRDGTDGHGTVAGGRPPPRSRRRVRTLAAGGVVGALFVIDSALIGISIMGASHPAHVARPAAHTQWPAPRPHRPATRLFTPVSAQAFDPYGDGEDENNELAPAAIDGNRSTDWHTFWYTTPLFGNLKPGTGLVVDMGRSVTITSVRALLGPVPGANVQLRIGDTEDSLSDMGVTATADDAGGQVTLRPAAAGRGRYVLIWFTKLPPQGDGNNVFQADIYDVAVQGP